MSRHAAPVDLLRAAEVEDCVPDGVDALLWRPAYRVAQRHQEHPAAPGTCAWCPPGTPWPCAAYDIAARALAGVRPDRPARRRPTPIPPRPVRGRPVEPEATSWWA